MSWREACIVKKVVVAAGIAREPEIREQISRSFPMKVMTFLASDEVSFLVTSLSAFTYAKFRGASLVASVPLTAIFAYRLITDLYKLGK